MRFSPWKLRFGAERTTISPIDLKSNTGLFILYFVMLYGKTCRSKYAVDLKREGYVTISEWLDEKESEGVDVTHIVVPDDLTREEDPEETIFFKQIRPCSVLCTGRHPFATVERFGHWYYSRGRKKETGAHTTQPQWWMYTKDRELAVNTAQSNIND